MTMPVENRSERKHRLIMEAATRVFLDRGYDGATMDEVASEAQVSKPTLYRYFADKERLYAEIIQATIDNIDSLMRMVSEELSESSNAEDALKRLARKLITVLMQPELLRLRRLVIANAERFPEVGRVWFAQGFGRVLDTLAACFARYQERGVLRPGDPLLAANHFTGLLLWIPLNRAMFSGEHAVSASDLERHAEAAVNAFLSGYGR